MKVKCLGNTYKDLFRRTQILHFNPKSAWPVEIGQLYEVYGISLWKGNLHYLIVNRFKGEEQGPVLCPAELFEITDPRLPQKWYFAFYGTEFENNAIWGYEELVLNSKHLESIQERDEISLNLFFERKKEIDEYFSQSKQTLQNYRPAP
jgi:hypothetical protein